MFIVLFFGLTGTSMAGSTVINVETEGSGDIIDEVNGTTNLNGATVWNGTDWVVNNTYAHKFFVDLRTGERLKNYPPERTRNYAGTDIVNDSYGPYTITGSLYSYDKPAADGSGIFRITGTQYTITDTTAVGKPFSCPGAWGWAPGASYFDIYFETTIGTASI